MTQSPSTVQVEVTVDYLPATKPFHDKFSAETTVEAVRSAAMAHFGVTDHQDRDTHRFWLEFEGARLTNTAQTLVDLLGAHRKGVEFNLVEEITKG